MQLRLLIASSLVVAGAAAHFDIGGGHHGHHKHPHPNRAGGDSRVFPFLTWLRDSAVEYIFGRPSNRTPTGPSYTGPPIKYSKYADEIVIRFNVTNEAEEEALADATKRLFLDVWAFTTEFVDVRVHKDDISSLLGLLPSELQTTYYTIIPDLSAAVWATYPTDSSQARVLRNTAELGGVHTSESVDNLFFKDYQPMPVVLRWMQLLEAMFPTYVQMVTIGKSWEGREIPALRVGEITEANVKADKRRKTLVVTGGIHAREWISTSTVNYLAWSFITAYGKEPMITNLLQRFDIVFIPALNPDGIEFTWQADRLWRKSRQHTNLRFCRGLDLDHAFGYEWDSMKHQSDPCSESYGGDQPFQAVEAFELAEWARNETDNNNVDFVGLIDLHSYSQQVLFPYSYSCEVDPPNLENLQELAAGLAKAIRLSSGETYGVASACEGAVTQDIESNRKRRVRIESGGGSAIDWFYHEVKAHYSYQIKLRDTGSYGFLLPPENIVPTGEEIFNAMKYLGDYLLGNNGIEKLAGGPEFSKVVRPATEQHPVKTESPEDDEEWLELRRRRRRR